jgi:hypothetical protein
VVSRARNNRIVPRRGSIGISDIPPRHPRFTSNTSLAGGKPIAF